MSILRTCQRGSHRFSDRRDRVQCRSAVHGATEAIRLVHAVLLVAYAPFVVEAMEMKMNDHVSNHRGQIQSLTSVHDVGWFARLVVVVLSVVVVPTAVPDMHHLQQQDQSRHGYPWLVPSRGRTPQCFPIPIRAVLKSILNSAPRLQTQSGVCR